jgi:hypothetical protein
LFYIIIIVHFSNKNSLIGKYFIFK